MKAKLIFMAMMQKKKFLESQIGVKGGDVAQPIWLPDMSDVRSRIGKKHENEFFVALCINLFC